MQFEAKHMAIKGSRDQWRKEKMKHPGSKTSVSEEKLFSGVTRSSDATGPLRCGPGAEQRPVDEPRWFSYDPTWVAAGAEGDILCDFLTEGDFTCI